MTDTTRPVLDRLKARIECLAERGAAICPTFNSETTTIICDVCGYSPDTHLLRDLLRATGTPPAPPPKLFCKDGEHRFGACATCGMPHLASRLEPPIANDIRWGARSIHEADVALHAGPRGIHVGAFETCDAPSCVASRAAALDPSSETPARQKPTANDLRVAVDTLFQRRGHDILALVRKEGGSDLRFQVGMLLGDVSKLLDVNDLNGDVRVALNLWPESAAAAETPPALDASAGTLKVRTATEVLGTMDSEGPLLSLPGKPMPAFDAARPQAETADLEVP